MSRISRVKKTTTIASTFAIALGIGFIMQYGDANAGRFASDKPATAHKPVLIIDYSPLTAMTEFVLKPEILTTQNVDVHSDILIDPDSLKLVALVEDIGPENRSGLFAQAQPQAEQPADCDIVAVTAPDDMGAVMMNVISDCRPNAAFSVNHSGMTFSAQTNGIGTAMLTIPALAVDATFFITFADGKSLATSTYAPDAARYNRVVFQWEGLPGTFLRTNEDSTIPVLLDRFGADVGEIPRYAEVYSFPAEIDRATGMKGVNLLAEVTEQTCGQDLIAESFMIFPGVDDLLFKDIRITVPDCQQTGAIIGLKKVLGEQTLALR